MRLYGEDERVYMECTVCCWGISGSNEFVVETKAFEHERDNPEHKIKLIRVEDER